MRHHRFTFLPNLVNDFIDRSEVRSSQDYATRLGSIYRLFALNGLKIAHIHVMEGDTGGPTAHLFCCSVMKSIASITRGNIAGLAPAFPPSPPTYWPGFFYSPDLQHTNRQFRVSNFARTALV
jgi:hypothetical protein